MRSSSRRRTSPASRAVASRIAAVCAAIGPWISPYAAEAIRLQDAMTPPAWQEGGSFSHVLGTDNLGRDILSRIIAGARISVTIALYAIVLSGGIGALAGMAAGYFGGIVDSVISRLIDVQMSVPALPLAMLFAAVLPPGEGMVVLVIVLTYWTWYARIVRGEVVTYEVQLLEGWTVMQALLALQENDVLEHELVGANATTLLAVPRAEKGTHLLTILAPVG